MNRIQNLIVVVWALALLLFVAFNWSLINRVVDISYLFMDFQVKVLLWLSFLGLAVPVSLRLIAAFFARTSQRRSEKELTSVKSKAYDGLTSEFDRLGEKLSEKLENQIKDRIDLLVSELTMHGERSMDKTGDESEEKPAKKKKSTS